jgi:hypothetical protein
MNMTPTHRKRLLFGAVLAIVVLGVLTAPVFASSGVGAGLGVLALSAVLPAVVLIVLAYVWSGADREAAKLSRRSPLQR